MHRFSNRATKLIRLTGVLALVFIFFAFMNFTVQAANLTVIVNSTGDGADANPGDGICATAGGACTLRAAIQETNATSGTDTIQFNIPVDNAGDVPTITPNSPLPAIDDTLTLNARTQPDSNLVELDGENAGDDGNTAIGLEMIGVGIIKGMVINRFRGAAIKITHSCCTELYGNRIGTDPTGTIARPNHYAGIELYYSNHVTIGGPNANQRNIISGNEGPGITLFGTSDNNTIQGNYIGTDVTGTVALGNAQGGIANHSPGIEVNGGDNNLIGGPNPGEGNLVSGNLANAIDIYGENTYDETDNNKVQGNLIGTDVTGNQPLGNAGFGVYLGYSTDNNVIGGDVAGAGNVIADNGAGIIVGQYPTSEFEYPYPNGPIGNIIQGNKIGTNADGTQAMGNGGQGILVRLAKDTQIGGTTPEARNIIAGNDGNGIVVEYKTTLGIPRFARNTTIQGNYIGVAADGTTALANQGSGIYNSGALDTTIGGTDAGAGNVISASRDHGIYLTGQYDTTDENYRMDGYIQGNRIGTDAGGTQNLGNGNNGIFICGQAKFTIGGSAGGNTIAFNHDNGILVGAACTAPDGITIEGNFIFSNGLLGIDLANDGVSANDAGDADVGANNLQNYPTLDTANLTGGSLSLHGNLNSAPDKNYRVEYFANAACDSSGYGEGETFLAAGDVTTDDNGTAPLSLSYTYNNAIQGVTATATDADGNTSEFSNCLNVQQTGSTDLGVSLTACDYQVQYNCSSVETEHDIVYNINAYNQGPDSPQSVVVTDAVPEGTSFVSATSSQGNCTLDSGTVTCNLGEVDYSTSLYGPHGAFITLILHVTAAADTNIVNTVNINSELADSNTNNNTAQSYMYVTAPETPTPTPTPFVPDPPAYLDGATNIIQNGGFENGSSSNPPMPIANWFAAGQSEVIAHDNQCGAANGGDGGFEASGGPRVGSSAQAFLTQDVDVTDGYYYIDGENINYNFEFWAGGKKGFPASVRVKLYFNSTPYIDGELSKYTFDPIFPDPNHDGLFHRQITGIVPHGTRHIIVEIEFRYEHFTPYDYLAVCADAFSMKLSRTGVPAANAQFASSNGDCGGNQPCNTDVQNALDTAGSATTQLYSGTYGALNTSGNVVLNGNIQFTDNPNFGNVNVASGAQVDTGANTIQAANVTNQGTISHNAPAQDAAPNTPVTFNDGVNHPTVVLTAGGDSLGSTTANVTMGQTPPTCGADTFPEPAVERWFSLSPTNDNVTNGATIRFYYNDGELHGLDPSQLVIWHCNGTNWEQLGGTPGSDANGNYVEISDVTHFSPFGVGNAAPTSATLTSFNAAASDAAAVHVTWETGSELTVVGFNVQRKTDTADFVNVNSAQIPAQNLGSVNGAQYAYDDNTVSAGGAYTYRLQVLLANGSSITADPVTVSVPTTDCATQAPTILAPIKGDTVKPKIKFDWSDAACATKYQIIVRRDNKKGASVIQQKNLTASAFAKKLEAGKYVWRVRAFNGTTWTKWTRWTTFTVQTK